MTSLISTVGIKYDDFGTPAKLKKTAEAAKKTEKAFEQLAGKTGKAAKGVGLFGNAAAVTGIKAKAGAAGVKIFDAAIKSTFPLLIAAGAALSSLATAFGTMKEMDFASAKFETLGGNADVLTDKLKLVSIELNGAVGVARLTGAAYDVASAGFTDAADAALILKAAASGSIGGFSDINTVAGATVKVMNAYGLSAKEATALVDKFAQTQNDGIITIDDYSKNIGKVASTAAGLKVPLSELNAVIAQSTAAGVRTESAFTGLNAALAQLSGGQASKKLGIEINSTTIAADGLLGTLKKLEGLDTGLLQKALGREGAMTLLPVIQNLERFEELIENQGNSAGASAEQMAIASNTIQGAWNRLAESFKNIFADQSELGTAIKLTLQGASVAVDILGVALKTLMLPFRLIIKFIDGIGQGISKAFGGKSFSAIGAITAAWTGFLKQVEIGFQAVEKFAEIFGFAIGQVVGLIKPAVDKVTEWFGTIPTWWQEYMLPELNDTWQEASTNFMDKFGGPIDKIKEKWTGMVDHIHKELERFWEGTPQWFKTMIEWIQGKTEEIVQTIKIKVIGDKPPGKNEDGKEIVEDTKEAITWAEALKGAWDDIKTTVADGVHGAIMGLIDGTKSLGESLAGIAKQIASLMLKKAIFSAFGLAEGGYVSNGIRPFASGGYATKPTVGLVGEAGEDEYVIPASKMAQSMQRYNAGARGESVIPGTGSSSGGTAGSASTTVNYSGPILNFNSEEFVPKSAIGQIINSAAARGAKAGEARTLSSLQNSRSRRSNIGL